MVVVFTAVDRTETAVNALQAKYKIVPLSAYGKPNTYQAPPVDPNPGYSMTDGPQTVILNMDTSTYFNMLARLMGSSAPPAREDAPMLARMAKIGLVPGKPFDMAKLARLDALADAVASQRVAPADGVAELAAILAQVAPRQQ